MSLCDILMYPPFAWNRSIVLHNSRMERSQTRCLPVGRGLLAIRTEPIIVFPGMQADLMFGVKVFMAMKILQAAVVALNMFCTHTAP